MLDVTFLLRARPDYMPSERQVKSAVGIGHRCQRGDRAKVKVPEQTPTGRHTGFAVQGSAITGRRNQGTCRILICGVKTDRWIEGPKARAMTQLQADLGQWPGSGIAGGKPCRHRIRARGAGFGLPSRHWQVVLMYPGGYSWTVTRYQGDISFTERF